MKKLAAFLISLFLLTTCTPGKKGGLVVLSNVPLHSVAVELCSGCEYHVIVKSAVHMHTYEPTPRDQAVAASSCAFVKVRGIDDWASSWRGITVGTPEPHFWLDRVGVVAAAETLDAVLRKCQLERYSPQNLKIFKRKVDSLFSLKVEGKTCASSIHTKEFISQFGLDVPCVLQNDEFREPSPSEVERFKGKVKDVGVVVKDVSDVLPPLPEGVRVITLNLHPKNGERYTAFLKRNVKSLVEGIKR